jgi:hypothetical protein
MNSIIKSPWTSLFFIIIGLIFSIKFQSFAWGRTSLTLYWIGCSLAYFFSLLSIANLIYVRKTTVFDNLNTTITIITIIFILITLFWTTFIIIAGQSGM